jgi:hypothetical protein
LPVGREAAGEREHHLDFTRHRQNPISRRLRRQGGSRCPAQSNPPLQFSAHRRRFDWMLAGAAGRDFHVE